MGKVGLEPTRDYSQRILSPLRLPITPHPRGSLIEKNAFSDMESMEQSMLLYGSATFGTVHDLILLT